MDLQEFLIKCRLAWLSKERIAQTITNREIVDISALSAQLNLDELAVSLAVAYLAYRGEISIAEFTKIQKNGDQIFLPKYSSREYLNDKEKRLKAEKKRVLERVRQALPEEEFTIPGLAIEIKEDSYAVMEAITNLSEVKETGRSIQASHGLNIFYPTYIKSKTA